MDYLEDHIKSSTNDFESKAFEPIQNMLEKIYYYDNYGGYIDKYISYTDEFLFFNRNDNDSIEIIMVFKEVLYNRINCEFVVVFDISNEGLATSLLDESQNISLYCQQVYYEFIKLFKDKSVVKQLHSYLFNKCLIINRENSIDQVLD